MNSKTVKLIRRFASAKGFPYRASKRAYNRYPQRNRFAAKKEMRETIFQLTGHLAPSDANAVVRGVFGQ